MNSNTFALRSLVPMGTLIIEGYLLPTELWTKTNKFGVSKTQAVLLAYPDYERSQAAKRYIQVINSKEAEKLTPQGFSVHHKTKVSGSNEKVDLLPVNQLPSFLKVCASLKSQQALELLVDLAGLSLQELFSDAFDFEFNSQDRQKFLKEWELERDKLKDAHNMMILGYEKKKHPGAAVHDYMTTIIFGETAAAARMKKIVDEALNPTIGLNYQDDIEGMKILAAAKYKYAMLKKGTWQEQVERACAAVM